MQRQEYGGLTERANSAQFLGVREDGGEKRRVGVRKWSFPPAGDKGKNDTVKYIKLRELNLT